MSLLRPRSLLDVSPHSMTAPFHNSARACRLLAMAALAHSRDGDQTGMPVFLHSLRVAERAAMAKAPAAIPRPSLFAVGLLHDAFEDGLVHLIAEGAICRAVIPSRSVPDAKGDPLEPVLSSNERLALEALCRGQEEYGDYILRVGANPLATVVKIADLQDNLDRRRLRHIIDAKVRRRLEAKYRPALAYLKRATREHARYGRVQRIARQWV